jgi:hypothetical protein
VCRMTEFALSAHEFLLSGNLFLCRPNDTAMAANWHAHFLSSGGEIHCSEFCLGFIIDDSSSRHSEFVSIKGFVPCIYFMDVWLEARNLWKHCILMPVIEIPETLL